MEEYHLYLVFNIVILIYKFALRPLHIQSYIHYIYTYKHTNVVYVYEPRYWSKTIVIEQVKKAHVYFTNSSVYFFIAK